MDRGKDGGRRHGALLLLTLLPMSYKGMVVTLAFGKTSITKRGYYHVTILWSKRTKIVTKILVLVKVNVCANGKN
jgi:hypothetical protein